MPLKKLSCRKQFLHLFFEGEAKELYEKYAIELLLNTDSKYLFIFAIKKVIKRYIKSSIYEKRKIDKVFPILGSYLHSFIENVIVIGQLIKEIIDEESNGLTPKLYLCLGTTF